MSEPHNYNLTSKSKRLDILARQASDTRFKDVFSPVFELYYDGPMGNYGANLKKRLIGYKLENSNALRLALELRQMNVPVIDTGDAFKQFIQDTPMMKRAVAIVAHRAVMCSPDESDNYLENGIAESFYAIVYEKRKHSDSIFIYTSGLPTFNLDYVRAYFRSKFFLFTPNQLRQSLELSGLYAIQDAAKLLSCVVIDINGMMCLRGMHHAFYLGGSFSYNEKSLMQDHVLTMLDALATRESTFSVAAIA